MQRPTIFSLTTLALLSSSIHGLPQAGPAPVVDETQCVLSSAASVCQANPNANPSTNTTLNIDAFACTGNSAVCAAGLVDAAHPQVTVENNAGCAAGQEGSACVQLARCCPLVGAPQ